jgi:hypothetical protein
MFKEYLVIDNILDNPQELVELSRKIKYDQNKVEIENNIIPINLDRTFGIGDRHWSGYRSDFLYNIDNYIFCKVFDEIFTKIFSSYKFSKINYNLDAHLHFLPETCYCSDKNYHKDTSENNNVLMAGVIYLTSDPKPDSGTILMLDDHSFCYVENRFNRLVIYNSDIPHRPQNGFGSTLLDSRLTLTFFVKKIEIKS